MTIGLSRAARELLAQLVEAQEAGAQRGLSENELWFTQSVSEQHVTVQFAAADEAIHTDDPNATIVLYANGLIERFTTIEPDRGGARFRVTDAGLALGARMTS